MSNGKEATTGYILNIDAGEDMGADELDYLTRQLQSELDDLDVGTIDLVKEEDIPAGTKTIEAVTLGTLALTVLPTFLPKLVEFLQSWVLRAEDRKVKIKTQVGDQSIELEYNPKGVSPEDLKILVETMTKAHAGKPETDGKPEKEEQLEVEEEPPPVKQEE